MGDSYPNVRAAAVQAASAFLDREASTGKAAELIREAGANGARIVGFPEGFIPAHPIWFHFHPGTGPVAFGALPFDRDRAASLVVPAVVHGRTAEGTRWTTTISSAGCG